jgi:iron-sulfur cluster assembly protein
MISFTKKAEEEILKTLNSPEIPAGYALRLGLKGGACSASYLLGLDKAGSNDETVEVNGIKVFVDRRHLMYIIGVEVDYSDTGESKGFSVIKH